MNTKAIIEGTLFNTLVIDVPQMKYTQMKLAVSGPGEVAVKFNARGVIDPNSFYSVKFTTITTWANATL
jgi:hypothetical protein